MGSGVLPGVELRMGMEMAAFLVGADEGWDEELVFEDSEGDRGGFMRGFWVDKMALERPVTPEAYALEDRREQRFLLRLGRMVWMTEMWYEGRINVPKEDLCPTELK